MAKIITVSNQKGGIGKTTTTVNLAAGLKKAGYKVLVIDLDPQRASSSILTNANTDKNLSHVFNYGEENLNIKDVVQKVSEFDIISSDHNLNISEKIIREDPFPQLILKEKLKSLWPIYNYIIIDCPPSLNMLTINALCAADLIITPIEPNKLSVDGLIELFGIINKIKKRLNPDLKLQMLISKVDNRRKIAKDYIEGIQNFINSYIGIFNTKIRLSTLIEQSQNQNKSIFSFDPNLRNGITQDFDRLIKEVISFEF